MVLHHRLNLSVDAIQNHHLTAVVNRDLKAASFKNAISKNLALLGCVSDKEFHFDLKKAPHGSPKGLDLLVY
jgi:hypothetical protein